MGRKDYNPILNKSMDFAIRIVNLYKYLANDNNEYILSKQILRSGTSIGANVREANEGISIKDFTAKIYIALKEARETEYWLELLHLTDYIDKRQYESLQSDCEEILKLLVSITKTCQSKS